MFRRCLLRWKGNIILYTSFLIRELGEIIAEIVITAWNLSVSPAVNDSISKVFIYKSRLYTFYPAQIYKAENNPLANYSIYLQSCKLNSDRITSYWFGSLKVCMFAGLDLKAVLKFKQKQFQLLASLPPPRPQLIPFHCLISIIITTLQRGWGQRMLLEKKSNVLNTPTATAEKEIQHSENKALLRSSKNKPAVVLYFCVKITKWKQEMLGNTAWVQQK